LLRKSEHCSSDTDRTGTVHPCGFRIHAGHFAERHGLIIIIALGKSIVTAGVGVSGLALGTGVIAAVVVAIALAAALWWAYFDLVMLSAEHRLSEAS